MSSWENAVLWYKNLEDNRQNILWNYFDDCVVEAANRYSESPEFTEIFHILKYSQSILDIAAGRGIASYGFARCGKQVTALEPDSSPFVGQGAIRELSEKTGVSIEIADAYSENLPFESNRFDAIFTRQGVHHFKDIKQSAQEIFRVLKKGGIFLAVREHVLNHSEDLESFLNGHPLHRHYGGEHAYTLDEYIRAFRHGGFENIELLKPFSSEINLFPNSKAEIRKNLDKKHGKKISDDFFERELERLNQTVKTPGILYSFVCRK